MPQNNGGDGGAGPLYPPDRSKGGVAPPPRDFRTASQLALKGKIKPCMTKQKRIISIKKNLCSEINLAPPSLGGECRSTQWTLRLPLCVPPPEGGSFDITSAACISLPHAIYILHCIAMHSPSLRICRITSRPLKTGLPASVMSPSLRHSVSTSCILVSACF